MEERGGCIRATPQELPWCFVITATCVAPPENQRRGQFWDTCLNSGAPTLLAHPFKLMETGAAECSSCALHTRPYICNLLASSAEIEAHLRDMAISVPRVTLIEVP